MHGSGKADLSFLRDLYRIIDESQNSQDLRVKGLADKIGLSRTQLHRKTKSVANQSVTKVIRKYKLSKAASMLKKGGTNITAVAFEVGFNNLSYFARQFKSHYGKTPSEYLSDNN